MKFESHIKNTRPKMDVEKPDEDFLWIGISQRLNDKKRRKRTILQRYALIAAASIVIAFLASHFLNKTSDRQLIFVNIDPQLAQKEAEYVSQIQYYSSQIKKTNFNLYELSTTPDNLRDIDDLVEAYCADLKQYGPNPELINSLVDLYEKKILLLQRMLNEIKKIENYEIHQNVL